jgi:hypothetical protein
MSRIARLAIVVLTAAAFAVVPVMAQAAPGHGNRCGKGHAKHTRALGKTCAKHRKTRAKHREKVAPAAPITVPAEVVKKCRDEQTADEVAFQQKYANAAGREALGRCIRLNAQSKGSEQPKPPVQNDFATAAQECAAEKTADPAAFVTKYGDESGREAFGRCVRQNAKPVAEDPSGGGEGDAPSDSGEDAPKGDGGDQSADGGDDSGDDAPDSGDDAPVESIPGLDSLFY